MRVAPLLCAVLLSGCSIVGLDDSVTSDLRNEKSAWLKQNLHSYQYEYEAKCFCQPTGTLIVSVHNDFIESITVKATGVPVQAVFGVPYYTIPQLYDYLIDASKRADEMHVQFDRTHHLPAQAVIDFRKNVADEELTIVVGTLSASTSL